MELHRCQFFDHMPSAVQAIAFHPSGDRVAVARTDGDIEIWNVAEDWLLTQVRHRRRLDRGTRRPQYSLT